MKTPNLTTQQAARIYAVRPLCVSVRMPPLRQAPPVADLIVWVQTQALAGNWVDATGFPFSSEQGYDAAVEEALREATALAKEHPVRLVRHFTAVIS